MITNTRTKTIKIHTLVIDDTEIERYLDEPDQLMDILSKLLTARPQPDGDGRGDGRQKSAEKKIRRTGSMNRKKPDREPCHSCGQLIPVYRQGKHKCKRPLSAALPAIQPAIEEA